MRKAAKFSLSLLITVGLLVICFIEVWRLLTPTFIKTELARQVYQLTGHSLVMKGDVQWSFFPWLGIEVQNVVMNNSGEFGQTPLAKADKVQLNVKLLPLLSRRFEIGTVVVKGFNIYLIKNPNGKKNWAHLLISSGNPQGLANKQEENTKFTIHKIETIDFERGKVFFDDKKEHKHTEFNELYFHAKNISLNKNFPFKLGFNFNQTPNFFSGDVNINGTLNVDDTKNIFNFSHLTLDGDFSNAQAKKSLFHATGDVVYIAKNSQFACKKVTVELDDYRFSGTLAGTLAPTLAAYGHLQSTALLIGGFLFKNVQTGIDIKNAIIALNSLTANLYEGNYTGDILIDTHSTTKPTVTLNGRLTKADVSALLTNVMHKNDKPFTGTLDMSTVLKFNLKQGNDMCQTLNGSIVVQLQNGILHGINIPALIELGQAMIKQTALPTVSNNQTDFGTIKGTFRIKNGVLFNQDLILQSNQVTASGQGTINLVDEQIDYHLNAGLVGHKTRVPVLIRGSFNHPMVAPDTAQIAKKTLTDRLVDVIAKATKPNDAKEKHKLKEELGDELKKLNLESLLY